MDKKKANKQLCAIVRPCGGVIEFIDTTRSVGDVFDSPSVNKHVKLTHFRG